MKRFIFGFDDSQPLACAQGLILRGIDAVVVGGISPEGASVLQNAGVDLYLCFGAHALGNIHPFAPHLAVNPQGQQRRWFSSACPNDIEIADTRLTLVLQRAQGLPGVKGIVVDGARFASFASAEGEDAFFTCFCPRCMAKMREHGLDAEAIRQAVQRLSQPGQLTMADVPFLREWLGFRESCVTAYMEQFSDRVHACNPAWEAGAFIFAPSLGAFVGQTMSACASLDLVSSMLYRAYPHADGPACLGHEWASFHHLLQEKASAFRSLVKPDIHPRLAAAPDPAALLAHGFTPAEIGAEVAAARPYLRTGQKLVPIVQIEDARQQETVRHVLENDADGVGYFAYDPAWLPPVNPS